MVFWAKAVLTCTVSSKSYKNPSRFSAVGACSRHQLINLGLTPKSLISLDSLACLSRIEVILKT